VSTIETHVTYPRKVPRYDFYTSKHLHKKNGSLTHRLRPPL